MLGIRIFLTHLVLLSSATAVALVFDRDWLMFLFGILLITFPISLLILIWTF